MHPSRKSATFEYPNALTLGHGYITHPGHKNDLDVRAVEDGLSHLVIYFSSQNKNKNDLSCGNFDASTH
jgi:hypothetical protein